MNHFVELLADLGPDAAARDILADIKAGRDASEKAMLLAGKSGLDFPMAYMLCAIALEKAGDTRIAFEYWNRALERYPCKLEWLQPALRLAFREEGNLAAAGEYAMKWRDFLLATFVDVPAPDILEQLDARGWQGKGCLGIHKNCLRGWLWLDCEEKVSLEIEPVAASFPIRLKPVARRGQKILYSLDEKLARDCIVSFACNGSIAGNPVICSTSVPGRKAKTGNFPQKSITVIIPVYDDRKATMRCLASVLASRKNNITSFNILAIWDHGPDRHLLENLRALAAKKKILLAETPVNKGFLGYVNETMRLVPEGNIILLNSDTLVHGNWVDRLAKAACASDAATVTALGNEAEHVSWPAYYDRGIVDNPRLTALIDKAAAGIDPAKAVCEIPVGVGFCMLITRKAIEKIGLLDGMQVFRGYGEEVDYSLRAAEAGLKNYAAPNVFVAHIGGRSFGRAKMTLVAQNNDAIKAKFPDYSDDFSRFLLENPLAPALGQISRNLVSAIEKLDFLHIYPWGYRYLPPWGKIDRAACRSEAAAALFTQKSRPGLKVLLRVMHEIPIGDIYFDLPGDLPVLKEIIARWSTARVIWHGGSAAISALAGMLGLEEDEERARGELLPMPTENIGKTWLASPPHDLSGWAALCRLARKHSGTRFYCPGLEKIWQNALRPQNLLDLPEMDDLKFFQPGGMLICDLRNDPENWRNWLEERSCGMLPLHYLEMRD